ncbi:hypothetical protein LIA77_01596 [Sarocladium implicatum]|nr:hypothetical protein LIA77_01596 [Sarocladium implicatum]
MKFTQLFLALMSIAIEAKPIATPSDNIDESEILARSPFAMDDRMPSTTKGYLIRHYLLSSSNAISSLDCDASGTSGVLINASDPPAKGNLSPAQGSLKLVSLNSGYHLSLYSGQNQSPSGSPSLRVNSGNVGNCWNASPGFQSWGLYNGN